MSIIRIFILIYIVGVEPSPTMGETAGLSLAGDTPAANKKRANKIFDRTHETSDRFWIDIYTEVVIGGAVHGLGAVDQPSVVRAVFSVHRLINWAAVRDQICLRAVFL